MQTEIYCAMRLKCGLIATYYIIPKHIISMTRTLNYRNIQSETLPVKRINMF